MLKRSRIKRAVVFGSAFACAAAAVEGCATHDPDPVPVPLEVASAGAAGSQGASGAPLTTSLPDVRARVKATLDDLAAIGTKRAGTPGGHEAGRYVERRLEEALGVKAKIEKFSIRRFDVDASSIDVTVDGVQVPMNHDVFAYSGVGRVEADLVDVGAGRPIDYEGKDVVGKIALVVRDPMFHRQAQYNEADLHGAIGMLSVSQSPNNLIQIGTVTEFGVGAATMPTVSVGKDDGAKVKAALAEGKSVRAVLDVQASLHKEEGRNVIAYVPGSDPSGAYLMVGAHYDSWFVGSTDNGTGVAAMLEVAQRVGAAPQRRLGLMFVGFDAEELGLFGAYDFLRKHIVVGNEPVLGLINLEMPAGGMTEGLRAMASTHKGPIAPAGTTGGLGDLYTLSLGLERVPALFGGLIPTDMQGMYWHGVQGLTTYCETEFYHTAADTPDKVDTEFLARASQAIFDTVTSLDDEPIQSFDERDLELWSPNVATSPGPDGSLVVTVTAKDAEGTVQPGAQVRAWLNVDDFSRIYDARATADGAGVATITVPASELAKGDGGRWLQVTVGKTFPLAEVTVPLN
jgi:peptidase M28-like protein/PA domain-containing protein